MLTSILLSLRSFVLSFLQAVKSAPGQVLEFNISAADQSGNWKQAVWSLDDELNEDVSIRLYMYYSCTTNTRRQLFIDHTVCSYLRKQDPGRYFIRLM